MTRADQFGPWPVPAGASLPERTRLLLARFDAEDKGYGFDDGGDGTMYATWFADLLDEWLEAAG